jgi:hypothetical protein
MKYTCNVLQCDSRKLIKQSLHNPSTIPPKSIQNSATRHNQEQNGITTPASAQLYPK